MNDPRDRMAQGQGTPRPDRVSPAPTTTGDLPDPDFGLDSATTPDVAYGNTDRGGATSTAMTGHQRHGLEGMAAAGGSEDATTGGILRGGDTTGSADTDSNEAHGMGEATVGGTLAQGIDAAPAGSGDVASPDPATATNQRTFEQGMRGTARDAPAKP